MNISIKTTENKADIYRSYLKEILQSFVGAILIIVIIYFYNLNSDSKLSLFNYAFILLIFLISILPPLWKIITNRNSQLLVSITKQKIYIPNHGNYKEEEIKVIKFLAHEDGIDMSVGLYTGKQITVCEDVSKKEILKIHDHLQQFLNVAFTYTRNRGILSDLTYKSIKKL